MNAPAARPVDAATLRNAVALVTGVLAESEPVLERQLDEILRELDQADQLDVITGFAGLVDQFAKAIDVPRDVLWQAIAARVAGRLTEGDNDRD